MTFSIEHRSGLTICCLCRLEKRSLFRRFSNGVHGDVRQLPVERERPGLYATFRAHDARPALGAAERQSRTAHHAILLLQPDFQLQLLVAVSHAVATLQRVSKVSNFT